MIVRGAVQGVVIEDIAKADTDQVCPVEFVSIDRDGKG